MPLRALRAAASSRLPLFGRGPLASPLVEPSLIAPVTGACSERLLETAVRAVERARSVRLEELTARIKADYEKYGKLIRSIGIKVE